MGVHEEAVGRDRRGDHLGDLVGLDGAQHVFGEVRPPRRVGDAAEPGALAEVGGDQTRAHDADRHPLGAQVQGEVLGVAVHGVLRGDVRAGVVGVGVAPRDRRGDDDPTPPGRPHRGHEGVDAPHDAEEVDLELPAPVVDGYPVRRTEHRHPGVEHGDLGRAELGEHLVAPGRDVGVAGHVATGDQGAASLGLDRGAGLGEPFGVQVGDGHIGPRGREGHRARATDAARAPGHHRDPAGQIEPHQPVGRFPDMTDSPRAGAMKELKSGPRRKL